MKNSAIKKGLIFGIAILFIGASVIPSTIGTIEKKTTFVGSTTTGYIQELIDNASEGDTIYLPSGTYYENIIINKSINLIGEDKDNTIIDGSLSGDVVKICADFVNISGFTICNSSRYYVGINITSSFNTISGNNISQYGYSWYYNRGIYIMPSCNNNIISNNTLSFNEDFCIFLDHSLNNIITDNTFLKSYSISGDCIYLKNSSYNIIYDNIIETAGSYDSGICISGSNNNTIMLNKINHNYGLSSNGIFLVNKNNNNQISYNNISLYDDGIELDANNNNNIINGNTILDNKYGIYISWGDNENNIIKDNKIISNTRYGIDINSNFNSITGNIIKNNGHGIHLGSSDHNFISKNNISSNGLGIHLYGDKNNITLNTISNNGIGIFAVWAESNYITRNNISSNNGYGIEINHSSSCNGIYYNNFINNTAYDYADWNNDWDGAKYGNYWSDYEEKYPNAQKVWWIGVWDTPYKLSGSDCVDEFPLINQYPKSVIKSKSRDKPYNYNFPLLNWLFEWFPNAFPILRNLLDQ